MPPFAMPPPPAVGAPVIGGIPVAPGADLEKGKAPVPPPLTKAQKKKLLMLKLAKVGGILGVMVVGFSAYQLFHTPPPPPPPPPPVIKPKPVPKPAVAATPPAAPKPAMPAPTSTAPVTTVAVVPAPATAPAASTAVPPAPAQGHIIVTSTQALSADVSVATTEVSDGPPASVAFLKWVEDAKIGGVFQGSPPRALINSKIARANTVVDENLGIVFTGIDADNKLILFKDKTGAIANKRY